MYVKQQEKRPKTKLETKPNGIYRLSSFVPQSKSDKRQPESKDDQSFIAEPHLQEVKQIVSVKSIIKHLKSQLSDQEAEKIIFTLNFE
jgi:hypothetical protein